MVKNVKRAIDKKPIPNQDLVKKAYYLYKNKKNIVLKHIKAHTGKQDEYSLGNEMADKLANKAIGIDSCLYDNKIYLNVSYNENDAKNLGAKWDKNKNGLYLMIININQKLWKNGLISEFVDFLISRFI